MLEIKINLCGIGPGSSPGQALVSDFNAFILEEHAEKFRTAGIIIVVAFGQYRFGAPQKPMLVN